MVVGVCQNGPVAARKTFAAGGMSYGGTDSEVARDGVRAYVSVSAGVGSACVGVGATMSRFLELHKWLIGSLVAASAAMFLVTLIVLPLVIIAVRPDYFSAPYRAPGPWRHRHPAISLLLAALKNMAGALFVVSGLLMCFVPGQGLLSMLVGLTMMNYPGKYRLERWIVTRRPIWRSLCWLRARAHVPPLVHPHYRKSTRCRTR